MNCSDWCSIGMKEGNLSPPVLAKNKGTEVFRLVSAAKAKLVGACPIPCLYCIGASLINEHSPSLRRFSQVSGSDCSLTDLLYIIASSYWFLQFFASQVWLVSGSDCPLSCLYCICRFNSLIVTVLLFAGFRQVLTGSDCPLSGP